MLKLSDIEIIWPVTCATQTMEDIWIAFVYTKKIAKLQLEECIAPFLKMHLTYITWTYVTFRIYRGKK